MITVWDNTIHWIIRILFICCLHNIAKAAESVICVLTTTAGIKYVINMLNEFTEFMDVLVILIVKMRKLCHKSNVEYRNSIVYRNNISTIVDSLYYTLNNNVQSVYTWDYPRTVDNCLLIEVVKWNWRSGPLYPVQWYYSCVVLRRLWYHNRCR